MTTPSASLSISLLSIFSIFLLSSVVLAVDEDWKCRTRNFMPTTGDGCVDTNFSWMFCSSSEEHADVERDYALRIFTSSLHTSTISWGVEKICALTHAKPKENSVLKYCSVLAASNSPCDDTVCASPQENPKSKRVVFCCDFCEDQVNTICEPIEGITMDRTAYCAPVIRSTPELAQFMMPTCMRKPNACYDPRTTSQMDIIQASMDLVSDGSTAIYAPDNNEAAIVADDLSGIYSANVAVPVPANNVAPDERFVIDAMPTLISQEEEGAAIVQDDVPVLADNTIVNTEDSGVPLPFAVGNTLDSSESAVIADQPPSQQEDVAVVVSDMPVQDESAVIDVPDMPLQADRRSKNPKQNQSRMTKRDTAKVHKVNKVNLNKK